MPNQIFVSYSHKDKEWLDLLKVYIKPFLREQSIIVWDDGQIAASTLWRKEIESALIRSDAAILLVSAHFIASDFIYKNELMPVLRAAQERGLKIFWIPVGYANYKDIQEFQAAGDPARPLESLPKPDLSKELLSICEKITAGWSPEPEPTRDSISVSIPGENVSTHVDGEDRGPNPKIVILYKRNAPDETLMRVLKNQLTANGYDVFVDVEMNIGLKWAHAIEERLSSADAVIPLLSATSVFSEMLAYELQIAHEAQQKQKGKPRLLPVRVSYEEPLPDALDTILHPLQYALWSGPSDNPCLVNSLLNSLRGPKPRVASGFPPVGGAMPLYTEYYLPRDTDREFHSSILRQDSVVLIKGPRQMGKTSLLARGLQYAREAGASVAVTDFQKLTEQQLRSLDTLLLALAEWIADQCEVEFDPQKSWKTNRPGTRNFERFMADLLATKGKAFVWALDEVDRIFSHKYSAEFFGLIRSWHNERATLPDAQWHHLTVAIAFATEAHLFIRNLNQSPFNVGTQLTLQDFTLDQIRKLNEKYESPLRTDAEARNFCSLVGGHPYLTSRGLHHMRRNSADPSEFFNNADAEDGPYGDHLRRIVALLGRDEQLAEYLKSLLRGQLQSDELCFYRLRAAGVISGSAEASARLRCELYRTYLSRCLLGEPKSEAVGGQK